MRAGLYRPVLLKRQIHTPTIVITGHDDPVVQENCESAGAVAFLLKPLQIPALLEAIKKAKVAARS
jgi:FixJ family two-component response regulator